MNFIDDSTILIVNDIETALKKDLRKFENNTREEIYDYIKSELKENSKLEFCFYIFCCSNSS